MKLMSKQRREAVQGLGEEGSPFVPTRTQKIFKNTANLTLRGSTYDAKHLDRFLGSNFGEKSFNQERNRSTFNVNQQSDHVQSSDRNGNTASVTQTFHTPESLEASVTMHRSAHANLPSYLVSTSQIKPTTSFLSLGRAHQKFDAYVDLADGPSTLQKRSDVKAKYQTDNEPSSYEVERYNHEAKVKKCTELLSSAQKRLNGSEVVQNSALRGPKQARAEIQEIAQNLKEYQEFKQTKQFLNKRDRAMRTGWRHGVVGVDDADEDNTQVFYQNEKERKVNLTQQKNIINDRRKQTLSLGMGTSDQLVIGSPDHKRTVTLHQEAKPDAVVVYGSDWKTKKLVDPTCNPPRMQTTFTRIFEPASNVDRKKEEGCMNKIKIERAAKLDKEDHRNNGFNILSGETIKPQVWIGSMGKQSEGFQLG